jgi:hypothetical protein
MTTAILEFKASLSPAQQDFEQIFEDLYRSYLKEHRADQPLRWIAEAIDQSIADLGIQPRVRWDARHFLLVNLHQIVVLPMDRGDQMDGRVWSLLRNDVKVILAKAAEATSGKDDREISAHAVLDATSQAYRSLVLGYVWPQ